MKFTAPFLALILMAAAVNGQDNASSFANPPILLAQAAPATPRDNAAASTNDRAAQPDDTFTIKSGPKSPIHGGEVTPMNLLELVRSGGWAMVPLAFLSVVTVMLVLVFLFTLRRSAILTSHYMNTADVLLKKKDYLGLLAVSNRHSEVIARIVQRTLDFATKNPGASFDTIREIAETEGGAQAASLQHRVTYLADIGMLSPMIGLLGTVVGIIRSFGVLGSGNLAQSRDVLLASGVSEALIATATGLVLGITAMGFYSLFRNRVHSLISDMEIGSAHILGLLATAFSKKREQSRVSMEDEF
ncbi:MotA/TolQ/ExbB proton channel family protein [Verrucomicrobiota bacterium sgz303538]